ncbi:MAG: hypothetical protein IPH57_02515 [Saprospiraceae bacterium]|nr:hypothetical protein [Saprospiraceae bacterium]
MKIFILFLTLAGFMGCCNRITSKKANPGSDIIESNENGVSVKHINKKTGVTKDYKSINNAGITKFISDLVSEGEPVRVHLDEDEMSKLFNENDFMEISFSESLIFPNGSSGISKFVYFLSGTFKMNIQEISAISLLQPMTVSLFSHHLHCKEIS